MGYKLLLDECRSLRSPICMSLLDSATRFVAQDFAPDPHRNYQSIQPGFPAAIVTAEIGRLEQRYGCAALGTAFHLAQAAREAGLSVVEELYMNAAAGLANRIRRG